jgi:hypothetical protein
MPASVDVSHLVDRGLSVDLADGTYPLIVVDWPALLRAQENRLAAAGPEAAADDPVSELYEYFLYGYEEEVHTGQWQPFGVLGLDSGAESFAELTNDGVLVFDLTRAGDDGAPVLWVREDDVIEVAEDLSELPISELSSADE